MNFEEYFDAFKKSPTKGFDSFNPENILYNNSSISSLARII